MNVFASLVPPSVTKYSEWFITCSAARATAARAECDQRAQKLSDDSLAMTRTSEALRRLVAKSTGDLCTLTPEEVGITSEAAREAAELRQQPAPATLNSVCDGTAPAQLHFRQAGAKGVPRQTSPTFT